MAEKKGGISILAISIASCLYLHTAAASAENHFSVYRLGPVDRHYKEPSFLVDFSRGDGRWGAEVLLSDAGGGAVGYQPTSSYGLRLTRFSQKYPHWGLAFDFAHYKAYSLSDGMPAGSLWKAARVGTLVPLDRYVPQFEEAQGANVLSMNGVYRWRDFGFAGGRMQPYVGAGLSHYRSHSDRGSDAVAGSLAYQGSGFGYQLVGGVRYRLTDGMGAFVEAKFNSGTAGAATSSGDDYRSRSFHAVGGIGFSF